MKIAYIDPVRPDSAFYFIAKELKRFAGRDTEIKYFHLDRGTDHLEYRYYEALIIPDVLHLLMDLENEGYDAAIIGCFYDPGIEAAREVLKKMCVVGVAEASLKIANTLGEKVTILAGREKHIPIIMEGLRAKVLDGKITSIKNLGFKVDELQDSQNNLSRIMEERAIEAVKEDMAEVIVLGCTMEIGHYEELQNKLNVPVIDPAIAGLKYAEFLVEIRNSCKWYTSKIFAYEAPPEEEIKSLDLRKQFGFSL
ncbi:aspartate/glutamate racemase family protein [Wukongibacter baidiensis]|uniref:aspartate/glutamate racemase family protein n=1 Tax=Wukongibacter baidiensis TaxID=1723361 RepID=UPI003D7F4D65